MNSEKRYFILGILATILFGVFVNVITPYFVENQFAWLILLIGIIIFSASIFSQEIRTWLAKKSLLNKKQRIDELQKELTLFNKTCEESIRNPNRFTLLVIQKFLVWLLILLFLLFSRISIGSILSVLTGSPSTDFFDFYALFEAITTFLMIIIFSAQVRIGWVFIERVGNEETANKYRKNIQDEIDWLTSKVKPDEDNSMKISSEQ
ncbi:MAG TPA: hypothetical protein DIW23_11530 [Anaerolineae bacterium]|nr:hypothetical protein [Anaerolineae bacterium]